MAIEKFNLKLQSSYDLTPTTKHLTLVREDGLPLNFVAGQFVTLLLTDANGEIKRRSYSLANVPSSSSIEIAISYVKGGIASETLFHLQPGQLLSAMGPAGKLVMQEESIKRYILVGTGTGIAPYRAMLPELLQRLQREDFSVVILQGVQYRKDLLYGADFLQFASAHPRAQFFAHYSRELLDNRQPHECSGYVQNHFAELALNPEQDAVYLCGNPNMIDEAFTDLQARGFASKNIRREKYISSN